MLTFAARIFLISKTQIDAILEDLLKIHNVDFYFYSRDSFDRRMNRLFRMDHFTDFEVFRTHLNTSPGYIHHFIDRITVNVTEMFRDPQFFIVLREEVFPDLARLPKIKIWHAGCSSGEEVVSVAILLQEAGLLDKCEILGTDLSTEVLAKAQKACYSKNLVSKFHEHYLLSGGKQKLETYFNETEIGLVLKSEILDKVKYQQHNLASGQPLGKFDLIVCRNVLIYFDRAAAYRTFNFFDSSTTSNSFLALGEKETIQFSPIDSLFSKLKTERIWKKNPVQL